MFMLPIDKLNFASVTYFFLHRLQTFNELGRATRVGRHCLI